MKNRQKLRDDHKKSKRCPRIDDTVRYLTHQKDTITTLYYCRLFISPYSFHTCTNYSYLPDVHQTKQSDNDMLESSSHKTGVEMYCRFVTKEIERKVVCKLSKIEIPAKMVNSILNKTKLKSMHVFCDLNNVS